jgi:hypothetical protein
MTFTGSSQLTVAKAGFILQGTTLRGWCKRNGVDPGYAHKSLAGRLNGPSAVLLRDRIIEAASKKLARG